MSKNLSKISLVEYSELCRDVYKNMEPTTSINHYLKELRWIRDEGFKKYEKTPFRARLYERTTDHVRVLVFRGSKTLHNWWYANRYVGLKQHSEYLDLAQQAYESACEAELSPIAVTGHSLGGYLAQYVSIFMRKLGYQPRDGVELPCAIAFNPPHVGGLTTKLQIREVPSFSTIRGALNASKHLNFTIEPGDGSVYPYIVNYRVTNDFVSQIGNLVGREYTLSATNACSVSEQMSRTSIYGRATNFLPGAPGKVVFGAVVGADYAACSYEAHAMDTVVTRLWIDATFNKNEILGVPVIPQGLKQHDDH